MLARSAALALAAAVIAVSLPILAGSFGPSMQIVFVVLAICTMAQPWVGTMIGVALIPVAGSLAGIIAPGTDGRLMAETLCLALVAGSLLRRGVDGGTDSSLLWPATAFALVATASIVVQYTAAGWPAPGPQTATDLLRGDAAARAGAALLEILLGLVLAVTISSSRLAARADRLTFALVAGLTGAAAINVLRFVQAALARADALQGARELFAYLRVSTEFPDVNAAGSIFALGLLCAAGFAAERRRRWLGTGAVLVLLAATVLAGSRTAFFAVLVAPACVRVLTGIGRRQAALAAVLFAAAIAIGTAALVWSPRVQANADAATAVSVRTEMLRRGLRMTADHPFSGVGLSRFFDESQRYTSPHSFGPENAHNNFVQILAELGIPGLLAFLWLLWKAATSVWPRVRAGDRRLFWTSAGVLAYLLTCLGGHPLLVFQAAVPFWLALGLAAGPDTGSAARRREGLIVAAVAVLMVASMPFRVVSERELHHLGEPSLGPWLADGDVRYRRVGRGYTLYVEPTIRSVEVPLRCDPAVRCADAVVDVSVEGTPVNSLRIGSGEWTTARIIVPTVAGYRDRRIDIQLRTPPDGDLLAGRPTLR